MRQGVARLPEASRSPWGLSLLVVFWSRVLVWEASIIAVRAFGAVVQPRAYDPPGLQAAGNSLGALLSTPVTRWDGVWYLTIARHGYGLAGSGAAPQRTNFFPLFPLLVAALNRVGIPLIAAAVIISTVSMVLALYALTRLIELDLPARIAGPAGRCAVVALALSPLSFFLSSAYAESLFLAVSIFAVLCARRGQWLRAGLLAGLGSAARGPGLLLLVPLLIIYLYGPRTDRDPDRPVTRWGPRFRPRADLAWLALAFAGMGAYAGYLALNGVDGFAFLRTQQLYWSHVLSFPWTGAWEVVRDTYTDLHAVFAGQRPFTLFGTDPDASVLTGWENLLPLVSLVLGVVATVGVWRRLPAAYGIYAAAVIVLVLISPVPTFDPLQGLPRYLLVLFPLFMWLGAWLAERPGWRIPVFTASGVGLALLSAEYATWHLVA